MTRLSEDDRQRIINDYVAGKEYKSLMKENRISHEVLKRVLKSGGVYNQRRPDYSGANKEQILADYQRKIPVSQICKRHSVSRDFVYKLIRRNDILSPFRVSKEAAAQISNDYRAGKSIRSISESSGFSGSAIETALKKTATFRDRRISEQKLDAEELKGRYLSGESMISLSHKLKTDRRAVKRCLVKNDVEFRSVAERTRVYDFNQRFFENVNDRIATYLLGFLWADGSNVVSKSTVNLTVNAVDKEIIELFKFAIGSEHPTYVFSRKLPSGKVSTYHQIAITSEIQSEILQSLGMVQNKTYTDHLYLPKGIQGDSIRHFIRGIIDGDGGVYCYHEHGALRARVSLAGHIDTLQEIKSHVFDACGVTATIHKIRLINPDICKTQSLRIDGNRNVIRFLQWLYKDSVGARLERKYRSYRSIIEEYFQIAPRSEAMEKFNYIHP